jgi:hypothetical protein
MKFLTFQDSVESLHRYIGSVPSDSTLADARKATEEAYQEIINRHNWTYLYKHGRVICNPPYATGTLSYDAGTGIATLTGGTFPSYAADCYLRVGTTIYRVNKRLSSTTLSFFGAIAPTDSFADKTFALYQDSYLLPDDFISQDQGWYENAFGGLSYVHPREWLFGNRYVYQCGIPVSFTITGDEKYPGRLVLRVAPIPQESRSIDFVYKRKPRGLTIQNYSTGTVTLANASAAVTGNSTVFTPNMAGSILRVSGGAKPPTPLAGLNPPVFETVVLDVPSTTSLTLADPAPATLTAVAYTISDPIDIEFGSMTSAFYRCSEMFIARSRLLKDKPDAREQFLEALAKAKESDSRTFSQRHAGDGGRFRQRLSNMPLGPDRA